MLDKHPNLTVVKLADGAQGNWTFLTGALPDRVELIDFYHAAEQLKGAFDAAHGVDSPTAAAQFEMYRHPLRHESDGVKRSGMRWGARGGQAIPTLRSLVQSRRFDHAWSPLARSCRTQVSCPTNVGPMRRSSVH